MEINSDLRSQTEHDIDNSDVITKLKLIGMIGSGEKLNVRCLGVQTDSFITSIRRTFQKEDRGNSIIFISQIINKSFELLNTFAVDRFTVKNSKGKTLSNILCFNLLKDLKKSIIGIQNLKDTYHDDKLFICKLEFIIEDIEAKIKDFTNKNHLVLEEKDDTDEKCTIDFDTKETLTKVSHSDQVKDSLKLKK